MRKCISRVFTLVQMVELPDRCPACAADFTNADADAPLALYEIQLDQSSQPCAIGLIGLDEWGERTHGGDVLVLGYMCGECGHRVAGHDVTELDANPANVEGP